MRWPCGRAGCDFQLTGTCQRAVEFSVPETQCGDYLAGRPAEEALAPPVPTFPPWTGDALGLDFLSRLAVSTPIRKVLVAGRHDSGKTTLLTSQLLELERGRAHALPGRFAGSYTLRGYERLTDEAFRWRGVGPIVPHTGRGSERDPGWLHLAFRLTGDRVRHLVLSDLPGEAFRDWATDGAALPSMGITDVWVVVDGADGVAAARRKDARSLMARVRDLGDVPCSVILTKTDAAERESIDALRQLAKNVLQGSTVYEVAAFPGDDASVPAVGVMAPLRPLLEVGTPVRVPRPVPSSDRYVDWFGVGV